MEIARIVKANSHVDYVAQVYGPGEKAPVPQRDEYGFGRFMCIDAEGGRCIVSAVYDTQLLNPEFGRLGPRLSPPADVSVFMPDYVNEQATLIGLIALGERVAGQYVQGVPHVAAPVNAPVVSMTEEEFVAFHSAGGKLSLYYARMLQGQLNPLLLELLVQTILRLEDEFPDQAKMLSTLRANLMWQSRVEVNR